MAELEEKLREAACFGDIDGVKVTFKIFYLCPIFKTLKNPILRNVGRI